VADALAIALCCAYDLRGKLREVRVPVIVRLTGTLVDVNEESVVLDRDGLAREVLVPRYSIGELAGAAGEPSPCTRWSITRAVRRRVTWCHD